MEKPTGLIGKIIICTSLIFCAPGSGESPAMSGPDIAAAVEPGGLHPVDWILIALYALSTIGLGLYFGRKQ
ncbi:MAG: hypothetical protein QF886_16355, partial [Planctomycetota bacterium]|nr:hypothetical protein [Planctomycetota bacterium]